MKLIRRLRKKMRSKVDRIEIMGMKNGKERRKKGKVVEKSIIEKIEKLRKEIIKKVEDGDEVEERFRNIMKIEMKKKVMNKDIGNELG